MNPSSIICLTGPSATLFVKSCWLCRLIRSFRPPDVFVPVCQRVHAVVRYPALCIKWRIRDLVHGHSVHLVALALQDLHFVHILFPSEESFFIVLMRYLFFDHIFFTPFAFLIFYLLAFSTEYILDLMATASSIATPAQSSFIFPRASLLIRL